MNKTAEAKEKFATINEYPYMKLYSFLEHMRHWEMRIREKSMMRQAWIQMNSNRQGLVRVSQASVSTLLERRFGASLQGGVGRRTRVARLSTIFLKSSSSFSLWEMKISKVVRSRSRRHLEVKQKEKMLM